MSMLLQRTLVVAAIVAAGAGIPTVAGPYTFYDNGEVALQADLNAGIAEPAVPVFHNGTRVNNPGTPGLDTFNVVQIYDKVPGINSWPLTWADLVANTYLRLTYQKAEGTSGALGTSVIGTPSFRTAGVLHLIPSVQRADVFTGVQDRVLCVLAATFPDLATVSGERSYPDPVVGTTTAGLKVTFKTNQNIALDQALLGKDALRLITLSSMFATDTVHDANVLRYEDSTGVVRAVPLTSSTPRDSHLFPQAVALGSWFELVQQTGSTWNPDSPTIRVDILSTKGISGRLGIQAFLAASTNPNDDSLSAWVEWLDAPPTIASGSSLEAGFRLTATPPSVLTVAPVMPTHCPIVATQCPTVVTSCPPQTTECPPTGTHCPVVATQCPTVATSCPPQTTECPPTGTNCPAVATQCPTQATSCPPQATKCPPTGTNCPAATTKCPPLTTKCPALTTKCPSITTLCPPITTKCPPVATACPPTTTKCPPVTTLCPPIATKCPPVTTACPTTTTRCPPAATLCPPITTKCPTVTTACPPTTTKCPPVTTLCPPITTKCPAATTSCPSISTTCPPQP